MKRLIISIVLIFFSGVCLSQSNIDTLDVYGNDKKYFRTQLFPRLRGCVKMRWTVFKKFNPDGYYRFWSSDSTLINEGLYLNHKRESVWYLYNEDGTVFSKTHYIKGEIEEDVILEIKNI